MSSWDLPSMRQAPLQMLLIPYMASPLLIWALTAPAWRPSTRGIQTRQELTAPLQQGFVYMAWKSSEDRMKHWKCCAFSEQEQEATCLLTLSEHPLYARRTIMTKLCAGQTIVHDSLELAVKNKQSAAPPLSRVRQECGLGEAGATGRAGPSRRSLSQHRGDLNGALSVGAHSPIFPVFIFILTF